MRGSRRFSLRGKVTLWLFLVRLPSPSCLGISIIGLKGFIANRGNRQCRHNNQPLGCARVDPQTAPNSPRSHGHGLLAARAHAQLLDRQRELRRTRAHLRYPHGTRDGGRAGAPSNERAMLDRRECAADEHAGWTDPDARSGGWEATQSVWGWQRCQAWGFRRWNSGVPQRGTADSLGVCQGRCRGA